MGHRRSGQLLQKRIHFASDLPFIRLENVVICVCQPYLYLLASAWQTDDCTSRPIPCYFRVAGDPITIVTATGGPHFLLVKLRC